MSKATSKRTRSKAATEKSTAQNTNGKASRNGKAKPGGRTAPDHPQGHEELFDLEEQAIVEDVEAGEGAAVAEDFGHAITGTDDHIDDPVRIYLMQMGEIPLLTRREEIAAAKRIERSRTQFRHSVLATDYVLQTAIGLLDKIRES